MRYWTRQSHSEFISGNAASALKNRDYKDFTDIVQEKCMDMISSNWDGSQIAPTLTLNNAGGSQRMPDKENFNAVIQKQRKYVLRRLTPTECLRLQGLPDWWCDGANGSDSSIYRMAGNGLAIPCACDVLGRIAEEIRNHG